MLSPAEHDSRVGSVLSNFHLLDGFPQGSTITLMRTERVSGGREKAENSCETHGTVLSRHSDFLGALGHL